MDAADVLYGVSMGKGGVDQGRLAALRAASRARRGRRGRRGGLSRYASPPSRWSGKSSYDLAPSCRRCAIAPSRGRRRQRARRERAAASRACASASPRAARRCGAELSASLFDRLDARDLGAARGGADPGRRRRPGDRRGRRPARGRGRGGRGQRARGDPRAAGRAARRARRAARRRGSSSARSPAVIMVVGVNGTGKTTTIGKLASVLARALRASR